MADDLDRFPLLTWNGQEWEAVETRFKLPNCGQVVPWPEGVDRSQLPRPRATLGERVTFKWGGANNTLTGEVRKIELRNYEPAYFYYDDTALVRLRYYNAEIRYTIYANGHARWVGERSLLGCGI